MISSEPTRTPFRPPRALLIVASCVLALGMAAAGSWVVQRQRFQAGFLHTARRILSMELSLPQASPTASFQRRYRPFRRWLMPGSQAAKYTRWLLQLDMSPTSGTARLVQINSQWSTRRPPIISHHGNYIGVLLNFYWKRSYLPAGHSQGFAILTVLFQQRHRRWQVSGLTWNSNPGLGPNHPNSFTYDFSDLAGTPIPPQGNPPGLKPRVSNP